MLMDASQTLGLGPNEQRRTRRRRMLVAALVAWALVATSLLGWITLEPRGPSQDAVWSVDAYALMHLERYLTFVAMDTDRWISTRDFNWTLDAVNWDYVSWETVSNATASPGGFPSGQRLGFNVTGMCVAAYGYNYNIVLEVNAPGGPPVQLAATQASLYENLSARLSSIQLWGPGRDPLDAMGEGNVTAIRTLMLTLWTNNQDSARGMGPILTQLCGP